MRSQPVILGGLGWSLSVLDHSPRVTTPIDRPMLNFDPHPPYLESIRGFPPGWGDPVPEHVCAGQSVMHRLRPVPTWTYMSEGAQAPDHGEHHTGVRSAAEMEQTAAQLADVHGHGGEQARARRPR